jgi:transcriptional regulator of acetoin/glycerol metabolism
MSSDKRSYNLAIVGAGRQGMAILEALVPARKKDQTPPRATLVCSGGHISNAAKVLRINRNTLYDKIKKYGLTP